MNRKIYIHQKVAVFVDIQNLYYSARDTFNRKVDFEKVLHKIVADRVLIRAFAYVVKLHGVDQKGFINTLKHIGYQVREKERETIDLAMRSLINKLLHRPTMYIKDRASQENNDLYIKIIQDMFSSKWDLRNKKKEKESVGED
ncbi:NYN domain-containing protein [Sulfurihydrogenibium sp.]|uniref:NYN domain-containing protein n=1 Tax=Sulfurihydrogenibium sp. TaxID=2053621 RepID=UPI0026044E1C|nr:NYN domain-containing protein [Sulfurihydrogenibium sp.]